MQGVYHRVDNSPRQLDADGNGIRVRVRRARTVLSNRGWRDQVRGRGYPRDYDAWTENQQKNYENGRLRAATFAAVIGGRPMLPYQPRRYLYRRIVGAAGSYW